MSLTGKWPVWCGVVQRGVVQCSVVLYCIVLHLILEPVVEDRDLHDEQPAHCALSFLSSLPFFTSTTHTTSLYFNQSYILSLLIHNSPSTTQAVSRNRISTEGRCKHRGWYPALYTSAFILLFFYQITLSHSLFNAFFSHQFNTYTLVVASTFRGNNISHVFLSMNDQFEILNE